MLILLIHLILKILIQTIEAECKLKCRAFEDGLPIRSKATTVSVESPSLLGEGRGEVKRTR